MRSLDGVIPQGRLLTSAHPFPTGTKDFHPCHSDVQGASSGAYEKHSILASTPGLWNQNLHMAKPPPPKDLYVQEHHRNTDLQLADSPFCILVSLFGLCQTPYPLLCHFAGWAHPFPLYLHFPSPPPLLWSFFKHPELLEQDTTDWLS